MAEQQSVLTSACPHPEAIGRRWGDPINVARKAQLQVYLDRWETEADHGERKGPFHDVDLTGADAYWLARMTGAGDGVLVSPHLEGANLGLAHLENAELEAAYLASASMWQVHLEDANLMDAQLQEVFLSEAHLEGAILIGANLERADLSEAHMERADLIGAQLTDADLHGVSFDKATRLNDTVLAGASFDQVNFDNANLTVVDWSLVTTLGDEHTARQRTDKDGKLKTRDTRLQEYKAAVRANRLLSVSLQAQGLAEDSDRFAYQAQVLQRVVLRYQRKLGAYLFSWVLAALAGYGYRLRRIFVVYGLAVTVFAVIYFLLGIPTDPATTMPGHVLNAFLVSLTAIHGRVFFEQFNFTAQAWVAAFESIVGIVIEGVFVAMLIQRFFTR